MEKGIVMNRKAKRSMTRVPKPRPRPFNRQHDYTVRVSELPVAHGLGSHLVISAHAPDGTQLWEFNGLAAGPDKEAKAVGLPWDGSDTIRVFFNSGPKSRFGDREIRNQRVVRWGSLDDINAFRRNAEATADLINLLNIDYQLLDQNSNAAAAELLLANDIEPRLLFRYGGFERPVPGYLHRLLKPGLY